MRYELVNLYNYIFGDLADIKKHLKEESSQEQAIEAKKAEIKKYFAELKMDFSDVIRSVKNKHLAEILDIPLEESKDSIDIFATPQKLKEFLDTQDGLLRDEAGKIAPKYYTLFIMFYRLCKIINLKFEKTGASEEEILSQAYKATVLFGTKPEEPRRCHQCLVGMSDYLNKHYKEHARPLHDGLLIAMPRVSTDRIHLDNWRKLIKKHGKKMEKLFQSAPAIEKALGGKAPESLEEANLIANTFKYKRAAEDPQLAADMIEFKYEEYQFQRALDVMKQRKTKDTLPDVVIKDMDKQTVCYLVKLPPDDPKAFVLGDITGCCQHIAGATEYCVFDGIRRQNNGFYVLLKAKGAAKNSKNVFLKQKSKSGFPCINYEDFEIIGQAYAWMSLQGNLVLDTFEPKHKDYDALSIKFLDKFAKAVVDAKESSIMRVTVGTGGNTPQDLDERKTDCAEVMREGRTCGDSATQATLYCNDARREAVLAGMEKKLEEGFAQLTSQGETITFNKRDMLEWMSKSTFSDMQHLLTVENIRKLQYLTWKTKERGWSMVSLLLEAGLLDIETTLFLDNYSSWDYKATDICLALYRIKMAGHTIDSTICQKLKSSGEHLDLLTRRIINTLDVLKETGISDNFWVRYSVFKDQRFHDETGNEIKKAFQYLREEKLDKELDIFKCVAKSDKPVEFAPTAVKLYRKLEEYKIHHVKEIKACLFDSQFSFDKIDEANDAYKELQEAKLQDDHAVLSYVFQACYLIKQNTRNAITNIKRLTEAKLADDAILRSHAIQLSTPENLDDLFKAFSIIREMKLEQDSDIRTKLLTICRSVIITETEAIKKAFIALTRANLVNYKLVREQVLASNSFERTAAVLIDAFAILKTENIENNPDIQKFIVNTVKGEPINYANAIVRLHKANIHDNDSRAAVTVTTHPVIEDPVAAADAVIVLQEAKLNTKEIRKIVLDVRQPVKAAQLMIRLQALGLTQNLEVCDELIKQHDTENCIAACLILQKENALDNSYIRSEIYAGSSPQKCALAYILLKKANLAQDSYVRKKVYANLFTDTFTQDFINAETKLTEAGLRHDSRVYSRVYDALQPEKTADDMIAVFKVLREHKLESDHYVLQRIFDEKHIPLTEAQRCVEVMTELKAANLEKNHQLKAFIMAENDCVIAMKNIFKAIAIFEEAKLDDNPEICKLAMLPGNSCQDAPIMAEIIVKLTAAKLSLYCADKLLKCRSVDEAIQGLQLVPPNLASTAWIMDYVLKDQNPLWAGQLIAILNDIELFWIIELRDILFARSVSKTTLETFVALAALYKTSLQSNESLWGIIRSAFASHPKPVEYACSVILAHALLLRCNYLGNDELCRITFWHHSPINYLQRLDSGLKILEGAQLLKYLEFRDKVMRAKKPDDEARLLVALVKAEEERQRLAEKSKVEPPKEAEKPESVVSVSVSAVVSKPVVTSQKMEIKEETLDGVILADSFAELMQQMALHLPYKIAFFDCSSKLKDEFLAGLKRFRSRVKAIPADDVMGELLLVVAKFYGDLIQNNCRDYLQAVREFLKKFHVYIPETLRVNASGKPSCEIMFNFAVQELRKALEEAELLKVKVVAKV